MKNCLTTSGSIDKTVNGVLFSGENKCFSLSFFFFTETFFFYSLLARNLAQEILPPFSNIRKCSQMLNQFAIFINSNKSASAFQESFYFNILLNSIEIVGHFTLYAWNNLFLVFRPTMMVSLFQLAAWRKRKCLQMCAWHPSNYYFNPHWKQLNVCCNLEDLMG